MRATSIILSCTVTLILSACGERHASPPPQADTAKIFEAIKIDEVHWNNDWKSGDASIVTAHYAPSAIVMMPGSPPAAGPAAIKAAVTQAMDDKAFSLVFASDKVDVAASGDLAAARGAYTQTSTDPQSKAIVSERGTYVTIYKPQPDGTWKAVWDINTPGAPEQAMSGQQ